MAKVSAIITTYNRAQFLACAIASVLNQSFRDFELLVIDDASSDDTAAVVGRFDDRRIRYLRHAVNKGESAARNTGIENSSGPYIAFLDDDDEWLPEKLTIQVDLLDRAPAEVGIVTSPYLRIRRRDNKLIRVSGANEGGNLFEKLKVRNCAGLPSAALIKRQCFERVGLFDERLRAFDDYDMWIRISREFLFESAQQPLVKYYVHDVRISTNPERLIHGISRMLEKYGNFSMGKFLSHFSIFAGIVYCEAGAASKSRKAFLNALCLAPLEVRHYLIFLISLLGPRWMRGIRRLKHFMFGPV